MGRRIKKEDERQIKRWKAIKRHISALKKNCIKGDFSCRPKQRQAILHWAYDSRKI
jgi:ribosomal protein L35